jgi:hypothetical protein
MHPIELNHIWTVVNNPTYEAIKNSPFIKELAYGYEQANTADAQIGWEGFYIRGKHTFIELFYPQERYKNEGLSGIGLGFDQLGSLKDFFKSFQKKFPTALYESFTRKGAPWFDYVAVNGSYYGEGHSLWIMEYAPDYFQENKQDVSREHYNRASFDPAKLLQDITGFSIALNPADQETLASYLTQCGMSKETPHVFKNASGVRIEITDESTSQKGIYKIDLLLNKALPVLESMQLGNSQIEIEGNRAFWHFKVS